MNSSLRKIIIISVILILVLITLPFKKSKSDEVVFWTLQMNDFAPYMNKVISDFETQNPNIKIKWVDVPFSEGEKRTLASVLSDNPPDLINLNPDFSALLAQKGALWEIDEQYTAQYNKSIINSLKYNGKLYSLPWYATSAVTIYNKYLSDKAEVILPKTYDDIYEIAPVIKSKTETFVMLPNITENDTMQRILNKYGVIGNYNSEKSVEVFEMFKTMYEKDFIPKETVTQTHREALEKYMAEKIVFFQAGANFLTMIKENAPSVYKKTDVSSQLTGTMGQYDFSLMNFVIPIRAKHKSEALKFALFLTNDENQLELAKLTNVLAVNEKTLKSDFYTKYDNSDLQAKARVISAKQLNNIEPSMKQIRNQKELNILINTAVQQILLNKASTKEILDDLNKKYKDFDL
ncbi:extracellular solute-binding protein [bacterium]|nr:extracellular solute-binding protein [bacterium]